MNMKNDFSYNNRLVLRNDLKLSQFHLVCECCYPNLPEWITVNKLEVNSSVSQSSPALAGYTPLHLAVKCRNFEAVNLLLELGADFTLKNAQGKTPLHLAISIFFYNFANNILNIIDEILLMHKTNYINPVDDTGLSHFHIASFRDKHSIIQGFLDNGVNVNACIDIKHSRWPGYTPLHISCKYSLLCTTNLLLKYGADISIKNATGSTPLHYAIKKGDDIIIQTLFSTLEKNSVNPMDNDGLSLLHAYSVSNYGSQCLGRFLQHDVNINLPIKSSSTLWPGYTPLHIAIYNKCSSSIMVLLMHGADVNTKDANGISPLQLAISKHLVNNNFMDIIWYEYNKIYLEPVIDRKLFEFYVACISANIELIQYFLSSGIDINHPVPLEYPLNLPGYTPLHFAVEAGNIETINLLLRNEADFCVQDYYGLTPLHLAVRKKNFSVVREIISFYNEVSKNPIDDDGLSHLHVSCMVNHSENVRKFLKSGEQVNLVTKFSETPLHYAVKYNAEETVSLLLQNKADYTIQDSDGSTPLHISISNEHTNITNLLLFHHTKDILKNPINKTGLSHFHIFCMKNRTDLVKTFINHGVSINIPVNFNSPKYGGFTPLHFAVKYKSIETIELLLNHDANISVKDSMGKVPLHYALKLNPDDSKPILDLIWNSIVIKSEEECCKFSESIGISLLHFACLKDDYTAIQHYIIEGSDMNECTSPTCLLWPSYSPLHFIAKYGSSKTAQLILSHHADIDRIDKYGFTPLHLACIASKLEIVEVLLKNGADPAIKSSRGLTPLRLALQARNNEIVNLLLNQTKSMYKNPMDNKGLTYFHIVCLKHMTALARDYIKSGVDLDEPIHPFSRKYSGYTPLHIAVQRRNFKLMDYLLSHGANVNICDRRICTPLHLTYDPDVVTSLLKKKPNLEARDGRGDSVIEMSIRCEKPKILKMVLQSGADPNIPHPLDMRFPLQRAMIMKRDLMVDILLDAGADYSKITEEHTIVHAAILDVKGSQNYYIRLFKRLIHHGYDLNALDSTGRTALHRSYYPCNLGGLEALLKCGADINVEDRSGRSVISYFVEINTSRIPRAQLYKLFIRHYIVRELTGFNLSNTNVLLHNNLFACWDDFLANDDFISIITMNISSEFKKMRDINFGGYTSLRDMLSSVHKMALHLSRNGGLTSFIKSSEFEDHFPECGCLIMLQYNKALKRKDYVLPALEVLDQIVRECFEDILWNIQCSEGLIEFLGEDDLRNLAAVKD